ncbi:EamA family transporter [Actinocorallia longicatena]|uniref:EamA family transporter n=1 Tax=Actinocorallia longicatena TaxID=111803 RepID=A0ABP6Q9P1_9ACTN
MAVLTQPRPTATAPGGGLLRDLALTALAPMSWGTTYVVTATLLPPDRPMLAAALRALPAGLVLLAFTRSLPRGIWWPRTLVLALLNFGAFFPLLFFAAYRLPGGVASTLGAVQPLAVAFFAYLALHVRPSGRTLAAALVGTGGVGLMTLSSEAAIDPLGVAAMLLALSLMALGVVLGKKWGRPEGTSLLAFTGWQLSLGGLILVPLTLATEGLPPALTGENILGFTFMGSVGTALAYALWFRGIERLPATSVSLLGLTNPLVATTAGLVVLNETLTTGQMIGFVIAFGALIAGQRAQARATATP